ncbi:GNAT family N-acetyltransferase [Kribbella sp. NPDC002412]
MDDGSVVRAIEENAAELLMAMGAAGGGVQRDDGAVRWTIGGSPLDAHNAVVAADLSAADVDGAIAESRELMRQYGVPGTWHVGPSMRPADLGDRLRAAGFSDDGGEPGMAVKLSELRKPKDVPGFELTRFTTDEALATWEATLGRGFGEGEKEARWVAEVYRRLGYGDPWRHYLGFLDGEPVATTTIFLGAGVAGVYFVMTVPEARRRGIGAAITYGALRQVHGVEYAVLGSSSAGKSVYESLGFRQRCTIELFVVPAVDRG